MNRPLLPTILSIPFYAMGK